MRNPESKIRLFLGIFAEFRTSFQGCMWTYHKLPATTEWLAQEHKPQTCPKKLKTEIWVQQNPYDYPEKRAWLTMEAQSDGENGWAWLVNSANCVQLRDVKLIHWSFTVESQVLSWNWSPTEAQTSASRYVTPMPIPPCRAKHKNCAQELTVKSRRTAAPRWNGDLLKGSLRWNVEPANWGMPISTTPANKMKQRGLEEPKIECSMAYWEGRL